MIETLNILNIIKMQKKSFKNGNCGCEHPPPPPHTHKKKRTEKVSCNHEHPYQGEVLPKLSFYNLYDLITLPCIMNFLFISKCYLTCNNTKEKRIQILYNIFCILYIEFSINCSMLCVFFFFFLFNITLLLFYNEIKKNKW